MVSSATSESMQFFQDSQVWDNLKQVIAASSGFQRWQMEHQVSDQIQNNNLDNRVRWYLRETLETLAY